MTYELRPGHLSERDQDAFRDLVEGDPWKVLEI